MGFPVFNIAMGFVAGYFTGRRIVTLDIIQSDRILLTKKVLIFTVIVMTCVCFFSAFLALNERSIGEELRGMLRLDFVPGLKLVIAGIIMGGLVLITLHYLVTRFTLEMTIRYSGLYKSENV